MAHPDLDRLLEFCIPFAQGCLMKRGEFYPFAATVHFDATLNPLAIDDGDDRPVPSEMIVGFTELIRSYVPRGGIEAAAICYDGRVTLPGKEKQDAITVFVEHSNGECLMVYLPYKKKLLGGYRYDAVVATEGVRKIFNKTRVSLQVCWRLEQQIPPLRCGMTTKSKRQECTSAEWV